jgi:hypothetical protein
VKKEKDSEFLICDCYSHGLLVERLDNEEEVYLSLFERGLEGRILPWSSRLKWCWQILIHGKPWSDYVILNTENQKRLKEFLK